MKTPFGHPNGDRFSKDRILFIIGLLLMCIGYIIAPPWVPILILGHALAYKGLSG